MKAFPPKVGSITGSGIEITESEEIEKRKNTILV